MQTYTKYLVESGKTETQEGKESSCVEDRTRNQHLGRGPVQSNYHRVWLKACLSGGYKLSATGWNQGSSKSWGNSSMASGPPSPPAILWVLCECSLERADALHPDGLKGQAHLR